MGPRRLGRFELHEELGRGGMGVVYRARDAESGAEVALKVLLTGPRLTERDTKRLQHEALLAARVKHKGIVEVLDAGIIEEHPFVAMRLVKGVPLARLEKTLDLEAHVRLLAKVARAVGAAHRASVVHRDLKPSNIIVDPMTLEPVVVDFGLAFDASFGLSRVSRTGDVVGTPAFMAPEVVNGEAQPDDRRLDVFALGLMLYRALGGDPYEGASGIELIQKIVHGVPRLPRGADQGLAALAHRATAIAPDERPPDADALADELERCLRRQPRAGRRPLLALAALAAAGLLAVLWHAHLPHGAPPSPPPAPPPRPAPPPPPLRVMPAAEVARLDALVERAIDFSDTRDPLELQERGVASEKLVAEAPALAVRWPDDPRALVAYALVRTRDDGPEYDVRRDMIRALRSSTPAPAWAVEIAGRFSHQLGFERAAAEIAERAFADDGAPAPERGLFLVQLYLRAKRPVADPVRSEALARRLLARREPGARDRPPGDFLFHMLIAQARIGLGDGVGAGDELEIAATSATSEATRDQLRSVASWCREGRIPRSEMGKELGVSTFRMAPTPFLAAVADLDDAARKAGKNVGPSAAALERLGATEAEGGRAEHAALALLVAARWRLEEGRPELRQDDLARADGLPLQAKPDTRSLVARSFAAALLDAKDAVGAEAAARASVAEVGGGGFDPRTPGELADGWVLVARALLLRGERARAREALAAAKKLAPRDAREIAELEEQLGR